jgi:hypothetical protein
MIAAISRTIRHKDLPVHLDPDPPDPCIPLFEQGVEAVEAKGVGAV